MGGAPPVECPVCSRTIDLRFINQHLDSNCQLLEKAAPSWGSLGQLRRPPPSGARARSRTATPSPSRPSPFVECPVCNKTVARINIDSHLDKKCLPASPATPRPDRQPSATSVSNVDALRPLPGSAFQRRGKPPIRMAHVWTWRHGEGGAWALDFRALPPNQAELDDGAFVCEMMCDDKTAPVRVVIRFHCDGAPFDVSDPSYASNRSPPVSYRLAPSLLKSVLQKNVRLCRPWPAVRTALQLIRRAGLTEFLRRFAVVMIEDAFLHAALPWLVSLLVACSKGFTPPAHCVSLLLDLVYEVAAVDTVDVIDESEVKMAMETDLDALGFAPDQSAIVRSLLLRASLGGMSCDVAMFKNAAHLWANRFFQADFAVAIRDRRFAFGPAQPVLNDDLRRIYASPPMAINVADVEYPEDDDLPLSAVDQHCSDAINVLLSLPEVRHLLPPADNAAAELLHTTIWRCSSSRSRKQRFGQVPTGERSQVQESLDTLFQSIRGPLEAYAFEYITQRRSVLKAPS